MSILVITVDLECCRCRAKITKVLDCLKAEFCIEKVEFEDKNNKVVVRGKFDAEKICKKVWCKASNKVVKEIVIAEVWPMPAPPKPCKPCEKEPETKKPEDSNTKPDKCDCGHCNPCKSKPEKCECDHCKPESKPDDKKKEEQPKPKTPPPKTEYKLIPYPVPYNTICPSWPWQCPPHQQCQGCQKPPQPPPPLPPPSPPRPCTCSNHGSCGCGGARLVWPPQPPVWPPPPWGGYNVVAEENSCTVM